MKYTAREIEDWTEDVETPNGWVPARPLNHQLEGWRQRIKDAWGVLTGKYDALDWGESQRD